MDCVVVVATESRTTVMRNVALGATVLDYYGENYGVEGYSVGGCGIEGYGEVYRRNLMMVSFGGWSGFQCETMGMCSSRTG